MRLEEKLDAHRPRLREDGLGANFWGMRPPTHPLCLCPHPPHDATHSLLPPQVVHLACYDSRGAGSMMAKLGAASGAPGLPLFLPPLSCPACAPFLCRHQYAALPCHSPADFTFLHPSLACQATSARRGWTRTRSPPSASRVWSAVHSP
jgi:hypothetical protein